MLMFFKKFFYRPKDAVCDGLIVVTEANVYAQLKDIIDAAVEVSARINLFPETITIENRVAFDELVALAGRVGAHTAVLRYNCGIELTQCTDLGKEYIYINNTTSPLTGVTVYASAPGAVTLVRPILDFINDVGQATIKLRDDIRTTVFASAEPEKLSDP